MISKADQLKAFELIYKDLNTQQKVAVDTGLTMVSNARFYSGKALDVRYRVPFGVMVLMILTFVLISSNPPLTLFGLFVVYSISGYVIWAWERFSGRRFS